MHACYGPTDATLLPIWPQGQIFTVHATSTGRRSSALRVPDATSVAMQQTVPYRLVNELKHPNAC